MPFISGVPHLDESDYVCIATVIIHFPQNHDVTFTHSACMYADTGANTAWSDFGNPVSADFEYKLNNSTVYNTTVS